MDLAVAYNQLNFWINKSQGLWYSPPDLDAIVHQGQLSFYESCFIKYGTGQRLNDALAPFKKTILFTTDANGLLTSPDDYMDLIDIIPSVDGIPQICPVVNDDEVTYRRRSQVIPNTLTAPFAEEITDWNYQLYPMQSQSGKFSYFSEPIPPLFKYTVVSGRVIVYNQAGSTQLAWGSGEVQGVLISTLRSVGINIGENDIQAFAEQANKENLMSSIKI